MRRIANHLLKRIEDLRQFPMQGVASPRGLYRLDVAQTPYLVFYRVRAQAITIIGIVHGRRKRRS